MTRSKEQKILAVLRRFRAHYWEARRDGTDRMAICTWQEGRWAALADLYAARSNRDGMRRCLKHLPGGSMGRPA